MKFVLPKRRTLWLIAAAGVILAVLVLGFRSPPVLTDSATVVRGPFREMVEEEGRTRVPDRYEVSSPVTGQAGRVMLEPGDTVGRGTALFTVDPLYSAPLDARSRAQAQAVLASREAALSAALAQVETEEARAALARSELRRILPLARSGHVSANALDQLETEARSAEAALRSARFSVDVARHERDNARAVLGIAGQGKGTVPIQVNSPVDGVVLKRLRQSEGPIQAGDGVLTIGSLDSLEIEVDVLSPDAVRIAPGMAVELERWGGTGVLPGRVRRIEPAGFTKISALGVEEQRVWVIVGIEGDRKAWQRLGDGYRVEARFILWQGENVLQLPASALFRTGQQWGVYVIEDGRAHYRPVRTGRRSGLMAEIVEGVQAGEQVVLHPGQDISDGTRVRLR